jgi:hypothetical protein
MENQQVCRDVLVTLDVEDVSDYDLAPLFNLKSSGESVKAEDKLIIFLRVT